MANNSGATMARVVLIAVAVWISTTGAVVNWSATGKRWSTLDRITLHSVDIDESGLLTVLYSKNFLDCTDLVEGDGRKTHSDPTFFCSPGSMVEETHSVDEFGFTNNEVRLCRDGDYDQCSEPTPIGAPAHRLAFYIHCDLAEDLARRLDLRFDCVAPSSELMNEIGRRLSLYAADLQMIFGKRTVRRLAFDSAADVFLAETRPHTGSCCRNPPPRPFGHELWIWAKLTDKPAHGTYGGTMGVDVAGAGVADGLHWDRIHDPAQLQDGSAELEQYWRQIDHITHEFEHVFGAGIGEYYGLAMLDDTTGVEPVVNVYKSGDNRYWSRHVDYFTDPLLHNIWNNELAQAPTSHADLLAKVDFAPVTAAVLNSAARFKIEKTVHDLSTARVRVVEELSGEPIVGAHVYTWNVQTRSPYSSEPRLTAAVSGPDGTVDFPWRCCDEIAGCRSCFGNRAHMKLIKAFADDHLPGARLFSVYDAQQSKLVDRRPELVIEVRLRYAGAHSQASR